MSFESARQDIESYLASNWTSTDICYQGIDPADLFTDLDEFIFVDVAPGAVTTRSIADGPQQRYMFIIQIDIYVPINTGTATANGYADALIALLLAKTIGDVLVRRVGSVYRQNTDSHFRTTMLFHAQMDA